VLAHQVPDAIMDRPHLVTLSVGPNDLRQGRSPQDFAGRTEVILERLQQDTDAGVILNALPDLALSPRFREPERSMVAALTRHYNHALQHVADDFGTELVDLGIKSTPQTPGTPHGQVRCGRPCGAESRSAPGSWPGRPEPTSSR
jgi:hypothetical protein